jgi:nitroreductase/NAD-dependent dihydropyrimidine dehydrogenase PreA subunit
MTQINYDTCTDCGLCSRVCGARIIREVGGKYEIHHYEGWECFACGNCMAVCPSQSITVEGLSYDLFTPLPTKGVDFDALRAALLSRRSVRNYKKDPVPRELIRSVLDAAATAPMGVPPTDVEVLVMDRRADIEEILVQVRKDYRGFLTIMGNPVTRGVMRLVQGGPMYHALKSHVVPAARHALTESEKGREYFSYETPALLLFHGNKYKVAIEQDCFIAASYATIAAHTLGLGTCFSGLIPPIVDRSATLRKRLDIPRDNRVYAGLMLGRPAVKFKRAIPRSFKDVRFSSGSAGGPPTS